MNGGIENTIVSRQGPGSLACVFLRGMLDGMTRAVEAEQCSLFLYDSQTSELVLEHCCGGRGLPAGLRRGADGGICGEALRRRAPVFADSFICAPLYAAGGICAVFNFRDKTGYGGFGVRDFRFVAASVDCARVIVEDLFEFSRQRRENQSLRREKEMTDRFAAIGAMAEGLMARIKVPVARLKIRAEELRAGCLSETSQRYLGQIREGLERIDKLSDPLAEAAPVISPGRAAAGVNRLLDEAIAVLTASLDRDIRILRRYCQGLPPIPDRGLEHVFVNIIKNAFEAMPRGGELEIATEKAENGVRIIFSDTGTGIPVNCRERIFEPFFTTKERKGTGLGLAISEEIIRMCGGAIDVKSLPGKGSRFSVFIPVQGAVPGKI